MHANAGCMTLESMRLNEFQNEDEGKKLRQSCGSRPEKQAVTSIVHVQDVKISLKGKEQLTYSEAQTKQTLWPQQCIVSTCLPYLRDHG